jgi:hypothetical protein
MLRTLTLCLGLIAMESSSLRGDVVIDFEGLTGMGNSPGSPVPAANQLSDQDLATDGVLFSSASPFAALVNLGVGHATSGSIGIGATNGSQALDYSGSIIASFFLSGSPGPLAVTDFVTVRGDTIGIGGPITLQAYDVGGNLLASDVEIDAGGTLLSVSVAGIHSVRFFSSTATVAFDDFSFGKLRAAGTVVPEPTSIVMLGIGTMSLFAYGIHGRRK